MSMGKISIFKLVPVAEQARLNLTLSHPKTGFLALGPIYSNTVFTIIGKKISFSYSDLIKVNIPTCTISSHPEKLSLLYTYKRYNA